MVDDPKIGSTDAESYQILSRKRIYGYSRIAFFNLSVRQYALILLLIVAVPILVFPRQNMVIRHLKDRGLLTEALSVIPASDMTSVDDATALLEYAALYDQAGRPEKAIAALETLLAREPANAHAVAALMELYGGIRDSEKRLAAMERYAEMAPADMPVLRSLVEGYGYAGLAAKQTDAIAKLVRLENERPPGAVFSFVKDPGRLNQIITDPLVRAVSRDLQRQVEKRAAGKETPFLDALIRRVFTYRSALVRTLQRGGNPLADDEDAAVVRWLECYVRTGMLAAAQTVAAELDRTWHQGMRNRLRLIRILRWNQQDRQVRRWLTRLHRENAFPKAVLAEGARISLDHGDSQTALFLFEQMHQQAPDDADLTRALADLYLDTGDPQRAFDLYKAVVVRMPACGDPLDKLLRIAGDTGNRNIAHEAAALGRKLCPEDTDTLRRSAELLLAHGMEADAIAAFRAYVDRQPADTQAAYRLAELYLWNGQPRQAYRIFSDLTRTSGGGRGPMVKMLRAASEAGDRTLIEEAVQTAVRFSRQDVAFQKELAGRLKDMGLYPEAIRIYRTCLTAMPEDRSVRHQLATLYRWTGQTVKAADLYAAASDREPEDFQLAVSAGSACVEAGSVRRATAYFERAVRIRPDDLAVRKKLATYYSWIDETDKRVVQLAQIHAAGQLEAEDRRFLAQIYSDRKRWVEVIGLLKHQTDAGPLPREPAWMLAEAYIRTGQSEAAAAVLMRIGSTRPEDPALLARVGEALLGLEKREAAAGMLAAALSADPGNASALRAMAEIEARKGNPGSAIQHLEAYCRKIPDDYAAHYRLAELYSIEGRRHKAHKAYKKALVLIHRSKKRSAGMVREPQS